MGYLVPIAVIDSSITSLFLYEIDSDWNHEQVETYLYAQGRKPSNCSWGVIDGTIIDLREDQWDKELANKITKNE